MKFIEMYKILVCYFILDRLYG